MPHTASTVRTLTLDVGVGRDEDVDSAMRRIDQAETDAVCRHLLGDLLPERLIEGGAEDERRAAR